MLTAQTLGNLIHKVTSWKKEKLKEKWNYFLENRLEDVWNGIQNTEITGD